MKSTIAFFKDLDSKFGTASYSTDICVIAIEQNTFYPVAASVVEIYIQENQQEENLHLGAVPPELIWKKILSKSRPNAWKIPAKEPTLLQRCRLEDCSCTKNEPSHSHPPRIFLRFFVIICDYFICLRTVFILEYFPMVASIHYAFFLL